MEELFERLPWLREEFETEQKIIEQLVMAEREYAKLTDWIKWTESLD